MFPGVFVDLSKNTVDFNGIVPINVNDPVTPVVYLELVACIPDTKEHEALVVASVKPSNVHAALLLIGLQPGKPGGWEYDNERLIPVDPKGDAVDVTLTFTGADNVEHTLRPEDIIVSIVGGDSFTTKFKGHWVFAGSRVVTRQGREWYDADGAGMLIGLATFGAETIAWSRTFSPDADVQAPDWIADRTKVPAAGTNVRITIRPAAK